MEHRPLTGQKQTGVRQHPRPRSMDWNMATNDSIDQEGIDPPAIRHIRMQSQVGTDTRGREHYFDNYRQCVWVLEGDELVWHQPLGDTDLEAWVDHVTRRCGWDTLFWSPGSVFDRLAEVFR